MGLSRVTGTPDAYRRVTSLQPILTVRPAQMQTLEGSTPDKQAIKPCDLTWVEFRLIDLDNNPVAGAAYEVKLTDGSTVTGRLDAQGSVRFSGISPGTASVSFVDLDAKEWTRV